MPTPNSFVFIDQSEAATERLTGAKRKAIRKQAMRDAGLARRERGGNGKINRRQFPLFVGGAGDLSEVEMRLSIQSPKTDAREDGEHERYPDTAWGIPLTLSRQGYERVRMEFDFDVICLSPLTTVHFSRAVASTIANDPVRLRQMMAQPVISSFIHQIPCQFEDSRLLQIASRWAMARAQRVFNPYTKIREEKVIMLLGDLLQELRKALEDPMRCVAADTICVSQLLAMLVVIERIKSWEQNIRLTLGRC